MGVMLESHLVEGNQKLNADRAAMTYGQSGQRLHQPRHHGWAAGAAGCGCCCTCRCLI